MNHRQAIEHLIELGNPQTFDELAQYELPIILELIEGQKCINDTLEKEAKGLNPWQQVQTPWEVERPVAQPKPSPQRVMTDWKATRQSQYREELGRLAVERAIERVKRNTVTRRYQARVRHQGAQFYLGTYATRAEADEAVFRFKLGIVPSDDPVS